MQKFFFLALLAAVIFSCNDDDANSNNATVNLHFKAEYDGSPLVFIEQEYIYSDGKPVKFQKFNFFISDVMLLPETGSGGVEEELVDVEFLDFSEHYTLGEAQQPVTFTNTKVPAGTYSGVRIGFGVPADQNNKDANKLPSGNPLRDHYSSHFWSDWDSFIFLKSEGVYDKDGNGFGQGDSGFGHHPGSNASYVLVTFNKPIVLKKGESFDLNFVLDVLKLYVKDGVPVDFTDPKNLDTQDPDDLTLAKFIMQNFSQAMILN